MTDVEQPFPAYKGEQPYICVSYAHSDSAEVALALSQCRVFLFYISPDSECSDNCQQKLNFALPRKRRVFALYLVETALSPGLELSLGNKQAITRSDYFEPAVLISKEFGDAYFPSPLG